MLSRFEVVVATIGLAYAATPKFQAVTQLSTTKVAGYAPFTHFAGASNCGSELDQEWDCQEHCEANPSFQFMALGGDEQTDDWTQYWFAGYDPDLATAIVAHQGSDFDNVIAFLTNEDTLSNLDSGLFPGVQSSIKVHSGFAKAQARTAPDILKAVQEVISKHKATSVTVVGHSFGAALSLIDSVYLRLHLPSKIGIEAVLYSLPRVGNQDWANFVDAQLPHNVTHINNKRDPVPTVPSRSLGYTHPLGEIHIDDSDVWNTCGGQENPSDKCIVGAVPNIKSGTLRDHIGTYDGIYVSCDGLP